MSSIRLVLILVLASVHMQLAISQVFVSRDWQRGIYGPDRLSDPDTDIVQATVASRPLAPLPDYVGNPMDGDYIWRSLLYYVNMLRRIRRESLEALTQPLRRR